MKEDYRLYLTFIQNTIVRLNNNSFQVKGLSVIVITALLTAFSASSKDVFIYSTIFPTIVFWGLDAYYLQTERKYREIYNNVIDSTKDIKLFSMDISVYNKDKCSYWMVFFSNTLLYMYLLLLLMPFLFILTRHVSIICKFFDKIF